MQLIIDIDAYDRQKLVIICEKRDKFRKIANIFAFSLDLHYLCTRKVKLTHYGYIY